MSVHSPTVFNQRSTIRTRRSHRAQRNRRRWRAGIERLESRHMLATVSIVAEDSIASESGQEVGLFRIFLSNPNSADTKVTIQVGGTATPNADYRGIGNSVLIPANTMFARIPVNAIDDALLEGTEQVVITLTGTNNPNDTIDPQAKSATVHIVDNDFNRPPAVTENTGSTVAEGGMDVITGAELNATDPDTPAAALLYIVTTASANGTVRRNGAPTDTFTQAEVNAGKVTYVHNGSETISDAFTFSIYDGTTTLRGNKFNLTITPVNDAPIVVNPISDQTTAEESAPTNINISGVFADADIGDKLISSVLSSNPALVNATLAANILTLTYGPNQAGTATITLTATDSKGAQVSDIFEAKVTNVNDPVDAKDDRFSSGGNHPITANVLGNDVDPDNLDADPTNDTLSAALVRSAANGTLTFHSNGAFTYTPNVSFAGIDSFTYRAFDGNGSFDDAKVLIIYVEPNVSPTARDDIFTVPRNTALNGNVLANDSDPNGDQLTATLLSPPPFSHGTVTLQSNGNFTFTPVSGFIGTTTFTYRVEDKAPGFPGSDLGSVTIHVVTPVIPNRPPDAKNDLVSTSRNTAVQINFLANDVDPDGDKLRVIAVGAATNGQVSVNAGGVVTYLPNHNFLGIDSFTYTISDDQGATDIGTVNVFVEDPGGVIATNDTFTVNEDTIGDPLDVVKNDFDTQGDALKVTAVTQPSKGVVEVGPNGANVLYTPNPNFSGTDVFTYTVADATDDRDTATVTVTVVNVDTDLQGTAGDDVFLVRRHPAGNVQVFSNEEATGMPLISVPSSDVDPLLFETLGGDDRVIVEFAGGSPLPSGGIQFLGGANGPAGDRLIVRNADNTHGAYRANASIASDGIVTIDGRNIVLTSVESIEVTGLDAFTVVTPNADDMLFVGTNLVAGTTDVTGTSGAVTLSPLMFSNISTIVIDAATNDAGAGNDSLSVSTVGVVPSGLGFVQYRSGTGANTLAIQNGMARIDSTVASTGTLDTNVADGAQIVTHRFRQTSLTLVNISRAAVVPDGTSAGTSVLNNLSVSASATLDLADNDLVLNPTAANKPAVFGTLYERLKSGYASGAWNGNGLTSTIAQSNSDTTLLLVDNAILGLTQFSGEPVDQNSLLVKYTYYGDIDLNGAVDADDLTVFANNFGRTSGATQVDGDIDFNGTVDADDLTVFANNFGNGAGAPLAVSAPLATVAPTAAAPLATVSPGLRPGVNGANVTTSGDSPPGRAGGWRWQESSDDGLVDLLARAIADATSTATGESLADARLALSRRTAVADAVWGEAWRSIGGNSSRQSRSL